MSNAHSARFFLLPPSILPSLPLSPSLSLPPSANSTSGIPAAVLGGARGAPTASVDDTYIANIIWDSPSSSDGFGSSSLQKSPLHKSTSALSELQQDGGSSSTPPHPPAPSSHFHNYSAHSRLPPPPMASRSFSSDYHNTPSSSFYHDDLELSPPSSTVSVNTSAMAGPGHPNQSGLRDFDLAEEFLQHFSRDTRQVTPPPGALPDYMSPRQPNMESRMHYPSPHTSSPIKRMSSPDVGLSMQMRGELRAQSNSPDFFLPAPDHHYRQPVAHSYSSSYQPPAPSRNAYSNPPSRSNSKPNFRPGMTGAHPQPSPNPHWYDGAGHPPPPAHRHHHSDVSPHREGSGQQRTAQQLPRSGIPLPRRHNEDTLDIQEFLQTVAESKTNPFGEGTLV